MQIPELSVNITLTVSRRLPKKTKSAPPIGSRPKRSRTTPLNRSNDQRMSHGDKNPRYAAALAASGSPDTSPSAHLDQGGCFGIPSLKAAISRRTSGLGGPSTVDSM